MYRAPVLRLSALATSMICAAALAAAPPALPTGDFSLSAGDTVWSIQATGGGYQATSHTQADVQPVFELTDNGRQALWKRMQWPLETVANARCLGNMLDVFCQVEAPIAAMIEPLKSAGSSYFHYDRASGVQAIHLQKR